MACTRGSRECIRFRLDPTRNSNGCVNVRQPRAKQPEAALFNVNRWKRRAWHANLSLAQPETVATSKKRDAGRPVMSFYVIPALGTPTCHWRSANLSLAQPETVATAEKRDAGRPVMSFYVIPALGTPTCHRRSRKL